MTIIGIDPSVSKSGVAVMLDGKLTLLQCLPLWDLFDFIKEHKNEAVFYIENSNLIKGNWHGATGRGNVGKNQSISQNIVDFLENQKCNYTELRPNGYSKVMLDATLFKKITGYQGVTNKDSRAAAAMILGRKK